MTISVPLITELFKELAIKPWLESTLSITINACRLLIDFGLVILLVRKWERLIRWDPEASW